MTKNAINTFQPLHKENAWPIAREEKGRSPRTVPASVHKGCGLLFDQDAADRRCPSGVAASETESSEINRAVNMSKRIVLIDRDNIRREQLKNALTKAGFDVTEFDSGKDAVQHLLFSSVHAVVLDYGSSFAAENPVPAGKQIVQEITKVDAFVPLILICDRCDSFQHETSAATDLILRRPFNASQLVDGVQTVLRETLRERTQRKSGYIFAFR